MQLLPVFMDRPIVFFPPFVLRLPSQFSNPQLLNKVRRTVTPVKHNLSVCASLCLYLFVESLVCLSVCLSPLNQSLCVSQPLYVCVCVCVCCLLYTSDAADER